MNKILIIGCGLIGSSILRAVYKKKIAKKIFILEKSKNNISKIKRLNLKCQIIKNFKNEIPKMDMIIFCTHLGDYEQVLKKINKFLNIKTVITDVGSTKNLILQKIRKKLKKGVFWTSSHPIAGSEVSGPEFGDSNLFKNKWCVLIKEKKSNKKHLQKLNQFWKKIGCKIVIMNAQQHDHIFAITSHLPHLIAYNIVKTALDFEKKEKSNLIKFSAGGLRDFSRIAASNETMWRDVFFSNQKNIILAINLFIKNLNAFKKDISIKNSNKITKKLTLTKKVRKKIILMKQDVNLPDFGRN
jgi:prephenate dehydrogenase/cyclohexadieny/prephenate dehydrogenase